MAEKGLMESPFSQTLFGSSRCQTLKDSAKVWKRNHTSLMTKKPRLLVSALFSKKNVWLLPCERKLMDHFCPPIGGAGCGIVIVSTERAVF